MYPDQVNVWQINPSDVELTRDVWACFRHEKSSMIARMVQRLNNKLNSDVLDEDIDLVSAVQRGVHTSGYQPGPLAPKEKAVGWFADRIRADLGELPG